jgi:hypothetical protein
MSISDDTTYTPSTGIIMSAVPIPVPTRSEAEDFRARLEAARDAMMNRDFHISCEIATTLLQESSLPIAQQVAAHVIAGSSILGQRSIDHFHEAVAKASKYLSEEDFKSFAGWGAQMIQGAEKEMNREAEERAKETNDDQGADDVGLGLDGAQDKVRMLSSLICH